jgi:outer membrane protein OmpA-like peptidoglycan-associated protein
MKLSKFKNAATDMALLLLAVMMSTVVLSLSGCGSGSSAKDIDMWGSGDTVHLRMKEAVLFDSDQSVLREGSGATLDACARVLKRSDKPVQVIGYTDSVGNDTYNQRLSQARAEAVKTALVERGIAPSRITTFGRGRADPVASNDTQAGRAQNRRVELVILHETLSTLTAGNG